MFNLSVTAIPNVQLPSVPDHLTDDLIMYMKDMEVPLDQRIMIRDAKFDIKEKNQIWKDWVHENITQSFLRASIQAYKGDLIPHRDMVRNFSLLYLVQAGGYNAKTCFYDLKPNVEVRRFSYQFKEVDEIASFKFEEGTWNLINNKYIHAVKGVTGERISFAVDFVDPEVPKFITDLS